MIARANKGNRVCRFLLQDARTFAVCHIASMADGWEATLLDMTPTTHTHGAAKPRTSDTGSPEQDDLMVRDTGDPGFDPNAIIGAAPKVLSGVAKVAADLMGGSALFALRD